MLALTKRGLIVLALAVVSSVSHGLVETAQGEDSSDIPCVGIRTAKDCRDEHVSLFQHCVWCESKAVPAQCVTPDMAEKLPKLVFKCDEDAGEEDVDETADE